MMRLSIAIAVAAVIASVSAVDRGNFKTCDQSNFCKRNREIQPGNSQFNVDANSIRPNGTAVEFEMVNTATNVRYITKLVAIVGSTLRLHVNELNPKAPRYEVQEVLQHENMKHQNLNVKKRDENMISLGMQGRYTVVIQFAPVRLDFFVGDDLAVTFNGRGLLNIEHLREKQENDPEGWWEEKFKSHTDTKPRGPESIGFDISFPGADHVYGIPEHATDLALKQTKGQTDPYRLYNLDVFEYELDNPMALYGSIPYMLAHRARQTTGVFFLNSAEMWIDVEKPSTSKGFDGVLGRLQEFVTGEPRLTVPQTDTHWIAESGVLDLFVFLGPSPQDIFKQYSSLTGTTSMPPMFSLGYHQCRWNYNDEADVKEVSEKLDEHHIPTDVIWLDIEHTDGKRYFTWDAQKFPTPESMQNEIAIKGRNMVNIVDPHIKRVGGYKIHEEAEKLGLYVKNKDGNDFDGWCWPGSSSWLDYMDPAIQDWWANKFSFSEYLGTTSSMYYWNDMNEPSVFNGPEVTMQKDNKHFGGWEHRDVHNIFGMWQQAATAVGIERRSGGVERPWVLSRAFFAGSQKYGAIWTGDNKADWGHVAASIPMILSISLAGLPNAGADMGGFFHNPEPEMLARWYQVGSYQPFMRAHAHLDTKRREPYLQEGEYFETIRTAVQTRYTWLPLWYTLFFESSNDGSPIMRPLWVEFPNESSLFAEQEKFLVGSSLLVAPALVAGQQSVEVAFPGSEPWYDVETKLSHNGGETKTMAAPLRKIPAFQRGGSILPRKMRLRRSTQMMHADPFTFDIALDSALSASGTLFLDDYHTYAYAKEGKFVYAKMQFASTSTKQFTLTYNPGETVNYSTKEWVERVVIAGFPMEPTKASNGDTSLRFTYDAQKRVLTIGKPFASVTTAGTVTIDI